MSVQLISAQDAIARMATPLGAPGAFSTIIDARSEDEFALDHLPGAVNWPSLNNQERILVGTMYKQVSAFEAQKHGAALVAANIARHIQRDVLSLPRTWQPLIYCWRGGKRSGSLAMVLGQIGFKIQLIEGGYKAFRAALIASMPELVAPIQWRVVCGPTGSGKTRLLHALSAEGAQVLDLEALANHRSSVLGHIPGSPQPSQKHFDTLVWSALKSFDTSRPVYVESESRKVGNLSVPEVLMLSMRESACLDLRLSDDERVGLLMEDYDFFVKDPDYFCKRLDALVDRRGRAVVEAWKVQVMAGHCEPVVRELLTLHYDPGYAESTRRNFKQFGQAKAVQPSDRSMPAMRALARDILQHD